MARLQVSQGTAVIFSRGPIRVEDGINKKHTADIHRGRFLSFVYHACSVHNRVGLAGKGWSVEQDRHRYATHYPPVYQHHSRASVPAPQGDTACSSYRTMPQEYSVTPRQTARLSPGPVVSTFSGKWQSPEHARQKGQPQYRDELSSTLIRRGTRLLLIRVLGWNPTASHEALSPDPPSHCAYREREYAGGCYTPVVGPPYMCRPVVRCNPCPFASAYLAASASVPVSVCAPLPPTEPRQGNKISRVAPVLERACGGRLLPPRPSLLLSIHLTTIGWNMVGIIRGASGGSGLIGFSVRSRTQIEIRRLRSRV